MQQQWDAQYSAAIKEPLQLDTDIEAGNIEIGTKSEIGVKQQLKQKQG